MARRGASPGYEEAYQSIDIDANDPYHLGRAGTASPGYDPSPRRPYYDTPYPQRDATPPYSARPQTAFYDPSGEATRDLRAVYDVPRYDSPSVYPEEKSEYRATSPLRTQPVNRLNNLARGGTKLSRGTSHSGQQYEDSDGEAEDVERELGRNIHIGPAPEEKQTRRNQTTKRVVLTNGNVVLDCPIPTRLQTFLPRQDHEEFRFMRYSAVTCDPNDFDASQFTLRPVLYQRDTELLIGITMYNEDEVLFTRTLHHVMKNIAHLCSREKSQTWGKDGWKKIVVCIISDGRKNINPRVLDVLAALGVYQDGVAKNAVLHEGEERQVEAHLYEYTAQLSVEPSKLQFRGLEKGITPVQILFCLKEKNAKKLNSHRWFFNAFAPLLQPNICILLDVGTKPGPRSLYHLWKTFDLNSNVGGACGEICAMKGKLGLGLLNPLVGAQNFEYKMSNILDKPTESLFGYIRCVVKHPPNRLPDELFSVLPGAFSACYVALQNDNLKKGPLASYFKGEALAGYDADVYTSNMYLAEDRILCWELVAKRGHHWVLKYVRQAQGETDVPDTVPEWISQRRRWLNGSFFAAIYSLTHVLQIFGTDHSFSRKMALLLEAFYNFLTLTFAWFGMANYYIFFMILTSSLEDPSFKIKGIHYANLIMQYLYAATLVASFVFALGNRPQGSQWKYVALIGTFAFLNIYMIIAAVYSVIKALEQGATSDGAIFAQIVISMLSTYGCYVASSLIAFDPWHLITSMGQYLLLAPVFVNLLQCYAFCNLHDFSWGTKSLDKQSNDLGVVVVREKSTVDVVLPTAQADIDLAYDDALHNLRTRPKLLPPQKTAAQKELMKSDYYRNVRTNVVLLWVLSNGILAAAICGGDLTKSFASGDSELKIRIYMVIILCFVAGMALFRFIASTGYRILTLFTG